MTVPYDIAVFGMRRSGNHAICAWLAGHFPDGVFYMGDVKRYGRLDPYLKGESARLFANPLYGQEPWIQREYNPGMTIIHTYEDYLPTQAELRTYKPRGKHFQLYILRDPFNLFASRLKMADKGFAGWPGTLIVPQWIQFASRYEAVRDQCMVPTTGTPVAVLFNSWHVSNPARRYLEHDLGKLPESDQYFQHVVNTSGIGSSFDGVAFDGNATDMPVTQRWEQYAKDKRFRNLISNPNLMLHAEHLFPALTRRVCSTLNLPKEVTG